MPLYEYRCRTCDDRFEMRRPMSEANEPAACPDGHPDAIRLLSVFASVGGSAGVASPATTPSATTPSGGGGCGSGCGCAH